MYQLAVIVFCPSNLISPVLLKKMAYITFFIDHYFSSMLVCGHLQRPILYFLDMLKCQKKNMYISLSVMTLEIIWWSSSLSNFKVSLQILTHSAFWWSIKSWRTQQQTNFFICSSSLIIFRNQHRQNLGLFSGSFTKY